ncbi:MAG: hypothetical protein K9M45_01635 [Kiritimatiellales bacterium]|nr:hypothetical protein [Kiritimatiellales bacterium]
MMKPFLFILLLLGLAVCAGAAVSTNDAPPAVQLDYIQLAPVKVSLLDTGDVARDLRESVDWALELRALSKYAPNNHSWLYVRIKKIEETAKTDRSAAEKMIADTVKKLRGWGADI